MFEVQGKLEVIYDAQQVSEKFKKREFVLEIQSGMYPEYPKLQLTQERCNLLDSYRVGDVVKVSFNLRGRPYEKAGEKTYFTNLEAWRIESAAGQAATPPPAAKSATTPPPANKPVARPDASGMSFSEGGEDDLPF